MGLTSSLLTDLPPVSLNSRTHQCLWVVCAGAAPAPAVGASMGTVVPPDTAGVGQGGEVAEGGE